MAGQGYDWKTAEFRWQEAWEKAKVFQARQDHSKPKFFINVPYPYVNGLQHLGFGVTFLHADIMARYKRMRGYNVLFAQAFHCTGLPILGAAERVKKGEQGQLDILMNMGIPEAEIPKFSDPMHWIDVFPAETEKDLIALGASVDRSRSFITTDRNPAYDAFVKWQFRKLRTGDFLRLGRHPVIWCPADQIPIGDHDRYEGEGEVPLEFTLLKFRLKERFVVAATLRPETIFGTTNIWVDPEVEYVEVLVEGERWIISQKAVEKLQAQGREVEILDQVVGAHLVGQSCIVPLVGDPVPILPSSFIDQSIGTGIVSSVPSDAPDDLVALRELQEDEDTLVRFQLDIPFVKALDPIPIIEVEGFGPLPAADVVDRMKIKSLREQEKLESAKEEVYRSEYYSGTMNDRCGDYAGMGVEKAKERVRARMIERGEADLLYEPSGPVFCRCLTRAIVKVVENQWFLAYGDPDWKARVHEALDSMELYPETIRKQFHNVIDWLRDWASTHHRGLGSRLPWDENWVIESLSDSTIYMAYYTIAHILQSSEVDPGKLTGELFDYVFLGDGDQEEVARLNGLDVSRVEEMRREFSYWYPFDIRHSGKDLVPNHLTFCLFNHVALFPKEHWPKAFGINGYLAVKQGRKMSKSKEGAIYLRKAAEIWGADATRITLAQGGEGLDDPSFDEDFAESIQKRMAALVEMATSDWKTVDEWRTVDSWFRSVLHRAIRDTRKAMERMHHRTALKHAFFDLQRHWGWYLRRRGNVPNRKILREFIEVQTKLLAPITPHLAEEIWQAIGGDGLIQLAPYPEPSEDALDWRAEALEDFLKALLDDVRQIMRATAIKPRKVVFYTSPPWKRQVYEKAVGLRLDDRLEVGALMKEARDLPAAKGHADRLPVFCKRLVKALSEMGPRDLERLSWTEDERVFLLDSLDFARSELQADVEVYEEGQTDAYDPMSKASHCTPWRPAIYLE
ncbi:MAG: leucine--tRNA ligase [Thermoplasmata archaeon]